MYITRFPGRLLIGLEIPGFRLDKTHIYIKKVVEGGYGKPMKTVNTRRVW